MSISQDDLRLILANIDKLSTLVGKVQTAAESKPTSNDREQRMAMLEAKMSLPERKPLGCPKAPPPRDDDASFPWPAQVQAFLKGLGIEQFPATIDVLWWLQANDSIDVSDLDGLPRRDRYRMGIDGGEYYDNEYGITHWRPTSEPEAPPSWDNDDDRVVPAVPSRERSDAEKELIVKTWRSLVPKLKRFGLRHLGSSEFLPAWLSDVRLALLEAELMQSKPTSGLEVAELPSFLMVVPLCKAPVKSWSSNPWSVVFRRLARNWAEHGYQCAGTRRPTATDRHQVQADDEQLQQTPAAERSDDTTAPNIALFIKVLSATGISSMPDNTAKANLIRVASAITNAPNAERKVQIEISGLSESTFYHHLSRIRSLSGSKLLFQG
jgi:hypothetical protein